MSGFCCGSVPAINRKSQVLCTTKHRCKTSSYVRILLRISTSINSKPRVLFTTKHRCKPPVMSEFCCGSVPEINSNPQVLCTTKHSHRCKPPVMSGFCWGSVAAINSKPQVLCKANSRHQPPEIPGFCCGPVPAINSEPQMLCTTNEGTSLQSCQEFVAHHYLLPETNKTSQVLCTTKLMHQPPELLGICCRSVPITWNQQEATGAAYKPSLGSSLERCQDFCCESVPCNHQTATGA